MLTQPSLSGNTATGDGDVRRPNLLSGVYGDAGDIVYTLGGGYGSQAFPTKKEATHVVAGSVVTTPGRGGSGPVAGGPRGRFIHGRIENR